MADDEVLVVGAARLPAYTLAHAISDTEDGIHLQMRQGPRTRAAKIWGRIEFKTTRADDPEIRN